MAKAKKRKTARLNVTPVPRVPAEVVQAGELARQRRWQEARDLLVPLLPRYPSNDPLLTELLNAAYELKDLRTYQRAAERLIKLRPNDPDLAFALAGAYMSNLRPALAVRAFQRALRRWPDHEKAAEARETSERLESAVRGNLAALGVGDEDALEISTLHEEALLLMEEGEAARGMKVAETLLRRYPDFVPVLNNLSQILFLDGHLDRAIATARRVLEIEPSNVHALGNLVHFLLLAGESDEARSTAERLKAVESDRHDVWAKTAEALSFLGDDEGVLDTHARASRAEHLDLPVEDALFLHLVAVAALRLGREQEARQHWKRALELDPSLGVARDNLADLRKPIQEQHAPWPFPLQTWVPERWIRELAATTVSVAERGDDRGLSRAMRRFLRSRPEMAAILPLLLDRGDREGRELALRFALLADTPELTAALRDFALSQRGPDELRLQAAQLAVERGVLPSGSVRLWQRGEWRDLMLFGFEIGGEPQPTLHSPPVHSLLEQAMAALHADDPDRAVPLLQQALELEPEAPDLLNNLAAAYELQGHRDEAVTMLRQIHDRHPDYLFARVGMAQVAIEGGRFDEARALLDPLLRSRQLHTSEFRALCSAYASLHLAEGQKEAARSWIGLWRQVAPDDPHLLAWDRRLGQRKSLLSWRRSA